MNEKKKRSIDINQLASHVVKEATGSINDKDTILQFKESSDNTALDNAMGNALKKGKPKK